MKGDFFQYSSNNGATYTYTRYHEQAERRPVILVRVNRGINKTLKIKIIKNINNLSIKPY